MEYQTGGDTLTHTHETDGGGDHDNLVHRFCPECERRDTEAGVKIKPRCGKQKSGEWQDADPTDMRCVVCTYMSMAPCNRCGHRTFP